MLDKCSSYSQANIYDDVYVIANMFLFNTISLSNNVVI